MLKSNFYYKNYNAHLYFIYFVWIVFSLSYFFLSEFVKAGGLENGVKYGTDTHFYLNEVNKILSGKASILDFKSKF